MEKQRDGGTAVRRGAPATAGSAKHKRHRPPSKAGVNSSPETTPVDRQRWRMTLGVTDSKVLTSGPTDGKLIIQNDGPAKIRVLAGTNVVGVHTYHMVASGHVMTVQFLGFVAVETIGKEPATFDFEVIESN
jgi:hypothetical protein